MAALLLPAVLSTGVEAGVAPASNKFGGFGQRQMGRMSAIGNCRECDQNHPGIALNEAEQSSGGLWSKRKFSVNQAPLGGALTHQVLLQDEAWISYERGQSPMLQPRLSWL